MRIIDSHVHLEHHNPKKALEMVDHFGYEKYALMAIPCEGNALNTLECLLAKRIAPERTYAFGGMVYTPGRQPDRADHEKQLELMLEAGCDGWKILESKPATYRQLKTPLDGDVFDGAFALAQREHVPVTWHAGDPATFWDAKTAPAFAVKYNWLCVGEGFPTLDEIYTQVENVMARYPKLCTSMAHLYFTSDDRAHAERMLDAYENFWLDLTPGSEMYTAFLADREGWRTFFETYQDKLVFGTDMVDAEDDVVFGSQDTIVEFVLKTLMEDTPFSVGGISGTGLGLAQGVLEKIFAQNFERRVGAPKLISASGLNAYVEYLMPRLTQEERRRAEALLR
ncbi:MAG: amidohydrolase family protein [Clostridia bacterium]|nr:amidohydrolase family protein [Clostridia bacterium]